MIRSIVWLLCLCGLSFTAMAGPAPAEAAVPASLRDWRGWVLHDLEYRACPFLATQAPNGRDAFVCAWPGSLKLDADAGGATFSVRWRVDAPSWVPLPGDSYYWPEQVTINARAVPVVARQSLPAVWLSTGTYDLRGRIAWRERPQSLHVPQRIGLIALHVDGKAIAPIERDGNRVTLGRSTPTAPAADSLSLRVYRKLNDGVPMTLTTALELKVSGQGREEVLGPVLPQGFVPTRLSGQWPARLDDDGRLHVQVQPGAVTLTLEARASGVMADVTARLPAKPWPRQEIWSYTAAPRLRVTTATGKTPVDPGQADVPSAWRSLPAFALGNGDALHIEQRSRGQAADAGNRLSLQREAWLDFSGGGWYARDHISGQMVQGWRFDVATPYALQRADAKQSRSAGADEALLVTRGAKTGETGVEWRQPAVDLAAGVRIAPATASLPVDGWQQSFDSVQTTLHLPFGYRLLGAPGADSVSGSWMSRWTLLDAFVCAIAVLLAWRLLGSVGAAATVVYLLIGYQEAGSPLWSLMAVFALGLIVRALPAGRLQLGVQWARRAALLLLVLIALPFVADQLRYALYPQLERSGGVARMLDQLMPQPPGQQGVANGYRKQAELANAPPPAAMPAPSMRRAPQSLAAKAAQRLETVTVSGTMLPRVDLIDHYAESSLIQSGPGEPDWTLGSQAQLGWTGPVLASQRVRLLIAPPWIVRPLRVVLVALLGWLLWCAFRTRTRPRSESAPVMAAALMLLVACAVVPSVHAQGFPSDALLQQLRERLTEAPKCSPGCASLARVEVSARGDTVSAFEQIDAAERVAVPLPAADDATTLTAVRADGVVVADVARREDGTLWIALDRGVHRIQTDYAVSADRASLRFVLRPGRVLFQGTAWKAAGLQADHLLTDTLNLTRVRAQAAGKPAAGAQQFPPYVRVRRDLSLGLDWTVRTTVQRISPAQGGFTVQVPVLKGEHVQSPGVKVDNGAVAAAIGDGSDAVSWSGQLDKGAGLTLKAPALEDRVEVWHVVVSPIWHVAFAGVPVVGPAANNDSSDYRDFEFHPLPGETLTLTITRPAPVQGAVRAIDKVDLRSDTGQHAATHELNFWLRATQGGEQAITLPPGTDVLDVERNGQSLNLRPRNGRLSLPVSPGTQRFTVRFRTDDAVGLRTRTPSLSLGLPAANVTVGLNLPADRWLLATWGPTVGPAVLYWGELAVMILVAFALARSGRTGLKFRHWLLLGLGFSTFSWTALLVVVAWLFAFDWRARAEQPKDDSLFDLSQVGLALLTLVALLCVISAIPQGLLGQPSMHVTGNASTAHALQWFSDRSNDGTLPIGSAVTLPMWVYKVLMLAWALWLANALIGWLRDAFAAWTRGGYWRAAVSSAKASTTAPPPPVKDTDRPATQ